MTVYAFADGQTVFMKYTELVRDHGQSGNNWSAMMAPCLVQNALGLDDPVARAAALDIYLTDGGPRQDSLDHDYGYYPEPGSVSPESLQYAGVIVNNHTYLMAALDRYDPSLNLFATYPNIPWSLERVDQLKFPTVGAVPMFGDGPRNTGASKERMEMIYWPLPTTSSQEWCRCFKSRSVRRRLVRLSLLVN